MPVGLMQAPLPGTPKARRTPRALKAAIMASANVGES